MVRQCEGQLVVWERQLVWPLALLTALSISWASGGQAGPKAYDPDPEVCQVETIRRTFRANLLPWQDQPEEVKRRLQQLQAAITQDTLEDCRLKGLLTTDQVGALMKELGLQATSTQETAPGPGRSQSPTRP